VTTNHLPDPGIHLKHEFLEFRLYGFCLGGCLLLQPRLFVWDREARAWNMNYCPSLVPFPHSSSQFEPCPTLPTSQGPNLVVTDVMPPEPPPMSCLVTLVMSCPVTHVTTFVMPCHPCHHPYLALSRLSCHVFSLMSPPIPCHVTLDMSCHVTHAMPTEGVDSFVDCETDFPPLVPQQRNRVHLQVHVSKGDPDVGVWQGVARGGLP
jgi:hypothetical protein